MIKKKKDGKYKHEQCKNNCRKTSLTTNRAITNYMLRVICKFSKSKEEGTVSFNICPKVQKLFNSHENSRFILSMCVFEIPSYTH